MTYTVEQRGEKLPYHGIHFHIVLEYAKYYKKSYVITAFSNHFSKLKSPIKLFNNSIDVSTSKRGLKGAYAYINGQKNLEKVPKVRMDNYLRKELNIQKLYQLPN